MKNALLQKGASVKTVTGNFNTIAPINYISRSTEILNRFTKVKRTGQDKWIACCPSHEDKNPSLAIRSTEDGKILLKCFAGCSAYDIVSAVGLNLSDLFPPKESTYASPIKNPFPAVSVLRCIQTESMIVATAACNIANGISLSDEDLQRLVLAASRIGGAYE